MNQLLNLIFACLFFIGGAKSAFGLCFAPLEDANSKKPSDWRLLIEWHPTVPNIQGLEFIQYLKEYGYGDKINLDYYEITFDKDSKLPIDQFFLMLRREFGSLLFNDTDKGSFQPYPSAEIDQKLAEGNDTKWRSENPTGALMHFVLDSFRNDLTFNIKTKKLNIVKEAGDVVVTCSSPTDFIFSVAKTYEFGWHPVSGNRGFGIKDNGNGRWAFYTMAADRLSTHPVARLTGKLSSDFIFQQGHLVWLGMLDNFKRKFANQNPIASVPNSQRYDYPACCEFLGQ